MSVSHELITTRLFTVRDKMIKPVMPKSHEDQILTLF